MITTEMSCSHGTTIEVQHGPDGKQPCGICLYAAALKKLDLADAGEWAEQLTEALRERDEARAALADESLLINQDLRDALNEAHATMRRVAEALIDHASDRRIDGNALRALAAELTQDL